MFGANLRASADMNSASTDERRAVLLTFACRLRFIDDTGIVFGEVSGRGTRDRTGEIPYCNPSSELSQSRQGSQVLVREMERKLLRVPGEGKQAGDEIDDKIYRASVTGCVQSVPYFRVGRRWSPWRSPPSAPER